jgi:hypothetical protein
VPYTHGVGGASGTVEAVYGRLYETCVDSAGNQEWCTTAGATVRRHYLVVTNKSAHDEALAFTLSGATPADGTITKVFATGPGPDAVNSTASPATVHTNGAGCIEQDSSAIVIPAYSVVRLEW